MGFCAAKSQFRQLHWSGVECGALFHIEIHSGVACWKHVVRRRRLVGGARSIRQFQVAGGCGTHFFVGVDWLEDEARNVGLNSWKVRNATLVDWLENKKCDVG